MEDEETYFEASVRTPTGERKVLSISIPPGMPPAMIGSILRTQVEQLGADVEAMWSGDSVD